MFKKKKTQFAIRKLKTGAGVLLISLGLLVNTAGPVLADSNQEVATAEISNNQQTATAQNSEPIQEAATVPANANSEQAAEKQTQETPAMKAQPVAPTAPVRASQTNQAQTVQTSSPQQTNQSIQQPAQTSAPAAQASQPAAKQEEVKQNTQSTSVVSQKEEQSKPVAQKSENKLTIKNDEDLKNFAPDFDANKLDQQHLLGIAGGFHLFGEDVVLNADTNGNIAAGKLEANVDFGTRGDSHNHTNGDIHYIESGKLHPGGFRNPNGDYIVLGDDFDVKVSNNQVFVNGQRLDNVKPEEIKQIQGYIDIKEELAKLSQKAEDFKKQPTTAGVKADFSDMNQQVIDLSGVANDQKIIYIDLPASLLANPQPITIKGLDPDKEGAGVVINVTGAENGKHEICTQIKLIYNNNSQFGASENHAHPNKLLWNFGTETTAINFSSGYFMGSVLAPQATITANVNVDGNIVGKKIVINGGESHRWDLNHPFTENVIPDQPTQPTDPTVPTEPEEPTKPVEPTEPEEPTTPEEPTKPVEPTQPEKPTQPVIPPKPEEPIETEETSEPIQPSKPTTSEEESPKPKDEFVPPLAEAVLPVVSKKQPSSKNKEKVKTIAPHSIKIYNSSIDKEIGKAKKLTELTKKTARISNASSNEEKLLQTSDKNSPLGRVLGLIASILASCSLALGLKKKKD